MWLLVGLGNPGEKYSKNRHNIGFHVIDALASDFGITSYRSKFNGLYAEARNDQSKIVLLKPMTYMNESGQSVVAAAKFFKISPERIVVFHDELDLAPFKIRVKHEGGVAGHNGLKSIKAHLGTDKFSRVRIGIGHPGEKSQVSNYVLSDFSKAEVSNMDHLVDAITDHLDILLEERSDDFMTKVAEY